MKSAMIDGLCVCVCVCVCVSVLGKSASVTVQSDFFHTAQGYLYNYEVAAYMRGDKFFVPKV